jgi:hypothetical protein
MGEENQNSEVIEEEVKPVKKTDAFKSDFVADVYAFFHQTSSTGTKVGLFEVNSKAGNYTLEGENFNWDEFVKIFKDVVTSEMIKDLVKNPQILRISVGEQYEDQKNYYKVECLEKKGE